MCRDFIGKSEDVSISHNDDPNLDCRLLRIFACVHQLRRPSFV